MSGRKLLLDELWKRSPDLVVTEDMFKASQCFVDLELLLNRFSATTSEAVVEAANRHTKNYDKFTMTRLLLQHRPAIHLSTKPAPKLVTYSRYLETPVCC